MISLYLDHDTRSDGPWAYLTYRPETPAAAFGPLEPFVDLWRSKCPAPGRFPAWRDFDILDFKGWWGQVSLAEMQLEPVDFRWALWGTKLTLWWGSDYTGQRISEQTHLAGVWQHFERPYFECLLDQRLMGFVTGSLEPMAREYIHIHGVDLPLDTDGVITHMLSAYQLRAAGDRFSPLARHRHRF